MGFFISLYEYVACHSTSFLVILAAYCTVPHQAKWDSFQRWGGRPKKRHFAPLYNLESRIKTTSVEGNWLQFFRLMIVIVSARKLLWGVEGVMTACEGCFP
jgi:hypothetical protein